MTLLDSTLFYHCCTSFYSTLYYSTIALPQSSSLYITLPWLYFSLLDSTLLYHVSTSSSSLYITLTQLYFILLHSTIVLLSILTIHCSIIALLHSSLYVILLRLIVTLHYYFNVLLHSTLPLLDST